VLDVPQRDRFQIITERRPGYLRFDPNYLDIDRDEGLLLIRITLSAGRATDAKQAFYRRLAGLLAERTGMRTENLAVVMIENEREDWSFGHGLASYLELPRDAWR
ncbi:MAG TPA: tautomerase family protein, partial [Solirubrobacteraceae bacterium]|nr:tautomerase family protein [Solirubrobacteraceae bacterium]